MAMPAQTQIAHLQPLVDELIALVQETADDVDGAFIRRAFEFAAERHSGQVRKSGEPYVIHPLGVAKICAQLRQQPAVIAAALLHDVVEDTETTIEELGVEFGDDVAVLVDGVPKLS